MFQDVKKFCLALLILCSFAVVENYTPDQNSGVFLIATVEESSPVKIPTVRRTSSRPAAPQGYVYWKTVLAKVTAYDPSGVSCGKYADGKTSLLDNAWKLDGVAVDPEAIPYRTKLFIPGVGFKEADDTGSAMKKSWKNQGIYQIDLRMTYAHQAREWGIRWIYIDLYKKQG